MSRSISKSIAFELFCSYFPNPFVYSNLFFKFLTLSRTWLLLLGGAISFLTPPSFDSSLLLFLLSLEYFSSPYSYSLSYYSSSLLSSFFFFLFFFFFFLSFLDFSSSSSYSTSSSIFLAFLSICLIFFCFNFWYLFL